MVLSAYWSVVAVGLRSFRQIRRDGALSGYISRRRRVGSPTHRYCLRRPAICGGSRRLDVASLVELSGLPETRVERVALEQVARLTFLPPCRRYPPRDSTSSRKELTGKKFVMVREKTLFTQKTWSGKCWIRRAHIMMRPFPTRSLTRARQWWHGRALPLHPPHEALRW